MPRLMTITDYKMVVNHINAQPLPEEVRKSLAAQFDKLLHDALCSGWPPGYEPGKGMPGTVYPPKTSRGCPECGGAIMHRSNCKIGFAIT